VCPKENTCDKKYWPSSRENQPLKITDEPENLWITMSNDKYWIIHKVLPTHVFCSLQGLSFAKP
jgi:hypothetical protein